MARPVRETALATRTARLRLPARTKPYWRVIEQGLHLGYRRRTTGGTWIARRRNESGIYRETKLSLADDPHDSNGDTPLGFSQAQRCARTWWVHEQRLASGLGAATTGPYTVARAMADYLEDYQRRGGKAGDSIESVARRNILPELGSVVLVKLTTRRLLDWHRAIAERPRRWRSRPGAEAKLAAKMQKQFVGGVRLLTACSPTSRRLSIMPGAAGWSRRTMRGAESSRSSRLMPPSFATCRRTRPRGSSTPAEAPSASSSTPHSSP